MLERQRKLYREKTTPQKIQWQGMREIKINSERKNNGKKLKRENVGMKKCIKINALETNSEIA